jgi:hypothetical protein
MGFMVDSGLGNAGALAFPLRPSPAKENESF